MSVLLGYDESPGAKAALTIAIDVASRYGEQLVVVYGTEPPGGVGEERRTHEAMLQQWGREAVGHALDAAAAAGVDAVTELVSARPVDALLEQAERHDARLIVVGTWGESPIRGAILGSTPHKLLHLSRRPVLCVPLPT
ncbi:universal stress protein [Agrococcus jenensis]|uniref:Nucleotide-binding universal stress UspA family protein n=1 Tax=Agrococcus jenensis TaxID=46353 RepID=A0A3N2ANR3_9MICO|nr:universal stress protein [Agrococcus jenensis]ROR64704.1 nucleotide-binding universal stress UspA family protein [Agrococcus jenensis]